MSFDATRAPIGWHPNWRRQGVTTRTRRTVLVVEDAIAVRNMLEDFLSLYGYEVLVASHPDTAFKRLKQSAASLDAMILDIGLDDNRSGIEVLELMRLDDRFVDLPVVVLTGDRKSTRLNSSHSQISYAVFCLKKKKKKK